MKNPISRKPVFDLMVAENDCKADLCCLFIKTFSQFDYLFITTVSGVPLQLRDNLLSLFFDCLKKNYRRGIENVSERQRYSKLFKQKVFFTILRKLDKLTSKIV